MDMIPVPNSSAIAAVGYNVATQTLTVEWTNGRIYATDDVPLDEWLPIQRSIADPEVSTGRLINQLKNIHDFTEV